MKKTLSILICLLTITTAYAQLFYKIEGNNLAAPSYLFGTHHLAPTGFLDSVNGLAEALQSAETVVGEVDMTGNKMAMALEMQPYMTAPEDSTLSGIFSPERLDRLNNKFEQICSMPGVNLYTLNGMRPMAVTNIVTIGIFKKSMPDYDASGQIDSFIQDAGASMGKKIEALETPADQARILFTTQPLCVQAEDLAELLDDPDKALDYAQSMNKAYLAHNLPMLYKLSFEEDSAPEFRKALIDDRNHRWVEKLKNIFADSSAFVAVGALHLPGDNGLVQLLQSAGYTVTPLDTIIHE